MNKWHLNVIGKHEIVYKGNPFIFELMENGNLKYIDGIYDENIKSYIIGYLKNEHRTRLIDKILNE